jgi:CRISPR-associated protein Cas1
VLHNDCLPPEAQDKEDDNIMGRGILPADSQGGCMQLYITDSAAKVGLRENRIVVVSDEAGEQSFPIEGIEGVSLFGLPYVSTKLMSELLRRNIDLLFYSTDGHYFGRFYNPENVNVARQKTQARLSSSMSFRLPLAKRIIRAKIVNHAALLRSYDTGGILSDSDYSGLRHSYKWLNGANTPEEVMGFEGNAAKAYFAALAKLVPAAFAFNGRSKRPPRDAFNSMISFGYSMLFRNIIGSVERHGLNPYFGFLHTDREGHPSLVSDLMEEWRALIVDDTVMQLVISSAVTPEMFEPHDSGAVYMSREGIHTLTKAMGSKMSRSRPYIAGDEQRYGFQYALDLQICQLIRALDAEDPTLYEPVEKGLPKTGDVQ